MRAFGRLLDALARRPTIIGGILALAVGVAAYLYLADAQPAETATVTEVTRSTVVVARRPIAFRNEVGRDDLELRDLPDEAIHPDALRTIEDALGFFASGPIRAGEQVLGADLAEQPTGGGLARLVPAGARGLSVAISDSIAAGGLVSPGDRVDVFAIFDAGRAGRSGSAVIVEDVEVLAVSTVILGRETDDDDDRSSSSNPKQLSATVTLSLDPLDAQRVAVAEEFGSLRLALRNPDDPEPGQASAVDLQSIVGQ